MFSFFLAGVSPDNPQSSFIHFVDQHLKFTLDLSHKIWLMKTFDLPSAKEQQGFKLASKLKAQMGNGESKKTINETTVLLDSFRKNLSRKFQDDLKKRTINYHSLIHRRVTDYFLKKPNPKQTIVAHLDYDKLNNKAFNLKWMTPEENYEHRQNSGITKGLINLNEFVTWKANHFGITQKLTSKITAFDRPYHFRDEQQKGAFKYIIHDHYCAANGNNVIMKDIFQFQSPFGFTGKLFDKIILTRYLKNLLIYRNDIIKEYAESEKWKSILIRFK